MGHVCYICKKELTWRMLKITYNEIINGIPNGFNKRIPPKRFSHEDRLCNQCHEKLLKPGSPEAIAKAEIEVKARLKKAKEDSGITAGECYWCGEYRETDQFCFRSDWILEDHAQCVDCNKIIFGLTSDKMKHLKNLENDHRKKMEILNKQHKEASYAKIRAGGQKYADMFTGAANAGIAGGVLPNSNTQFLENSANQAKGSLEIQSIDAKQEMIRISNLIKNERIVLAKKHFSKNDSRENTNDDEPLKILKTRLAKGEITLQEFNELKRVL